MDSLAGSFRRRGIAGKVGLVVAICVGCAILTLVAWNAVRLARGQVSFSELACVDPTDPCNYSTYRVHNDTTGPVVLRECMHHCGRGDRLLDPIVVESGRTTSEAAVTALVGSRNWWEVESVSDRRLGCLVLDGHGHKRDGDLVDVSAIGPCSTNAARTPVRPEKAG
jgi:hypothetical protein